MKNLTIASLAILMLLICFSCNAEVQAKTKNKPTPKPLITFVELGSVNCVPCKMMKPVMKAIQDEYKDKVQVVFYDVNVKREMSAKYKIRVIPTQVFLDSEGKEFFRHEGYYPKEEIEKLINRKLGITATDKQ
ncbi:MAG TPA: thioredoxin family protein [Candidatus Cloacimonadota bacterium]|nr:thioredoxin family protein [Candidatus Cloacimonadota bacterium]